MGPPSTPSPICVDIPVGLEEIVPDYLDSQRKMAGELLQLLTASKMDAIRRMAHNLKGGAAFGFPRLSEFGAGMEHSLRESNLTALTEQIKNLAEYLERVELRQINTP
jgi:HPt (histidine-containing phosphotransfer) domain-containing protein